MVHEESGLSSARVLDRTSVAQRRLSQSTAKIPRFARDGTALASAHIRSRVGTVPLSIWGGCKDATEYQVHGTKRLLIRSIQLITYPSTKNLQTTLQKQLNIGAPCRFHSRS
jgi:hypothetical protein